MQRPFNVLVDKPPETCEVNGRLYQVNTDFRYVLSYLRLQEGPDEQEDKIVLGLHLFFGTLYQEDMERLAEWLGWFLKCGEGEEELPHSGKPVFDLLQDSGYVYAAFLQTYKIDLRRARLHWWIFSELLKGLPAGTGLANVMELRGKKLEDWMKPAQRAELIEAQLRVRIKRGELNDDEE